VGGADECGMGIAMKWTSSVVANDLKLDEKKEKILEIGVRAAVLAKFPLFECPAALDYMTIVLYHHGVFKERV
jgi:hypothetical protein